MLHNGGASQYIYRVTVFGVICWLVVRCIGLSLLFSANSLARLGKLAYEWRASESLGVSPEVASVITCTCLWGPIAQHRTDYIGVFSVFEVNMYGLVATVRTSQEAVDCNDRGMLLRIVSSPVGRANRSSTAERTRTSLLVLLRTQLATCGSCTQILHSYRLQVDNHNHVISVAGGRRSEVSSFVYSWCE